jgi:hypothetical protein
VSLSDDQRALLRLLAKREEGYEDIAALKGLSVDDLRAEVNAALAQLESAGEGPPPPAPAPTPEPLVAEEPPAPAPPTRAQEPAAPPLPEPKASPPTAKRPSRPAVPAERRRLLLLTGGALAVVAVVLSAIALIGGGDDGSDSSSAATGAASELTAAENSKVTQAVLSAPDGGDAGGRAVFGRVGKDEIVLQVTAENLEPSAEGVPYAVWLYRNSKLALRVGTAQVSDKGVLGARFPIPAELLAYVASGAFDQIYVSRTSNAAYKEEEAKAKANKSLPRYTGDTVLTGEITGPVAKSAEGG